MNGTVANDSVQISWDKKAEGHHGQTSSTLNITPGNTTLTDLKLDHLKLDKAELKTDKTMSRELLLEDVELAEDQLLSDVSPLSAKYRRLIPNSLLKGRKLHLSLRLPVTDGKIDLRKSEVTHFHLDHSQADNQGWFGSGTKYVLDSIAPYTEDCSIESITISEGRLWAAATIKGYTLWLPLIKVRQYDVKDEQALHLPELLHGFTHAHFTELSPVEQELLEKVQSGSSEALHHLDVFCRTSGTEKACKILKHIDINPWITKANQGDEESLEILRFFNPLFRRYPETTGKALAISLVNESSIPEADVQFFCSKPMKQWLDPVALAEFLSRAEMDSEAYDTAHRASEKSPGSARLAYHSSVMLSAWQEPYLKVRRQMK